MKALQIFLMMTVLAATNASALFDGGPPTDSNEYLAKLFGQSTAFTATAMMSVKNKSNKETQAAEIQYSYLEGKLRADIEIAKTKAGQKNAEAAAMAAAFGMGNMVFVLRPDKKVSYAIYPGLGGYCESPLQDAKGDAPAAPAKIQKTEIGREIIDKHPCIKQKVVITGADGKAVELISWEATDLKNFPIQTQMPSGNDTVTTLFKDIKLVKPPPGVFEVPSGLKRYDSLKDLAMGAAEQLFKQQGIK